MIEDIRIPITEAKFKELINHKPLQLGAVSFRTEGIVTGSVDTCDNSPFYNIRFKALPGIVFDIVS